MSLLNVTNKISMGLLTMLGLRRRVIWDKQTLIDELLDSPLQFIILRFYLIVLWLRGTPVRPPPNKPAIKVVCLSDTHDEIVPDVPDGDLLIHAGDLTSGGTAADIQRQFDWLASLPHRHKVVICGNHDSYFDLNSRKDEDFLGNQKVKFNSLIYLERKSVTLSFKGGRKLNIYGAPDLPECGGSENAFQYNREENPWRNKIPFDTDILVTHTPPKHHLDLELGCDGLLEEVWRIKPKLHVFGHVHCGRGKQAVYWGDCQAALESLMSRKKKGPIRGLLPNWGWVDAVQVIVYGIHDVLWHWLMLGNKKGDGCMMINAGCQDGIKGRLTKKTPFTVEI